MVSDELIQKIGQFFGSSDPDMKNLALCLMNTIDMASMSVEEFDELNAQLAKHTLGSDLYSGCHIPYGLYLKAKVNQGRDTHPILMGEAEVKIF